MLLWSKNDYWKGEKGMREGEIAAVVTKLLLMFLLAVVAFVFAEPNPWSHVLMIYGCHYCKLYHWGLHVAPRFWEYSSQHS